MNPGPLEGMEAGMTWIINNCVTWRLKESPLTKWQKVSEHRPGNQTWQRCGLNEYILTVCDGTVLMVWMIDCSYLVSQSFMCTVIYYYDILLCVNVFFFALMLFLYVIVVFHIVYRLSWSGWVFFLCALQIAPWVKIVSWIELNYITWLERTATSTSTELHVR